MSAKNRTRLAIIQGKLIANPATITEREAFLLNEHIKGMEALLDDADQEDTFGTEGWRHCLGLDD